MAVIARTKTSIRFFGDKLVPDEMSLLLGCEPTYKHQKGEVLIGRNTGKRRIAKTGLWRLEANEAEPGDLDHQIQDILSRLTNDMDVWSDLVGRYEVDLFCGLFMDSGMEGIGISSENLRLLGDRGVEIGFDIYGPE